MNLTIRDVVRNEYNYNMPRGGIHNAEKQLAGKSMYLLWSSCSQLPIQKTAIPMQTWEVQEAYPNNMLAKENKDSTCSPPVG